MKPEQRMWAKLGPLVRGYGDFIRVENMLFSGMPDVNYCISSDEGWIENKCVEKLTASGGVSLPHYTDTQRRWAKRRTRCGGTVWFLLRVCAPLDTWVLLRGVVAAKLYEATDTVPLSTLRQEASWTHDGPLKAEHMREFTNALRNVRVC